MPVEIDVVSDSGQHVFVESGLHVVVDSGQHVMISGQPVTISGDHVFVESGVHVVADIAESGMGVQIQSGVHVQISGQHVFVESGVHVIADVAVEVSSGLFVDGISGQHVFAESGVYLASGMHVVAVTLPSSETMIVDHSGNTARVSQRHRGLIVTQDVTSEIHQGEMYHLSHCHSGLESDANCDLLIVVASGIEMHSRFGVDCQGGFEATFWENTTCSDSGTPTIAHNMNRVCSGQPHSLFSLEPTVTSTHTLLWCAVGGGVGKYGEGGTTRETAEWILNGVSGSLNYLLRVTNKAGAAKDASVAIEFSEETPVFWW